MIKFKYFYKFNRGKKMGIRNNNDYLNPPFSIFNLFEISIDYFQRHFGDLIIICLDNGVFFRVETENVMYFEGYEFDSDLPSDYNRQDEIAYFYYRWLLYKEGMIIPNNTFENFKLDIENILISLVNQFQVRMIFTEYSDIFDSQIRKMNYNIDDYIKSRKQLDILKIQPIKDTEYDEPLSEIVYRTNDIEQKCVILFVDKSDNSENAKPDSNV
jgi:hypothetical protein